MEICAVYFEVLMSVLHRNVDASERKANESFDNGVFFDIEAVS
jgi:hypothetical protein